jgi:hypothetical protein
MLRFLYCCALRLHPRTFRQKFADEMLSIFDRERGRSARILLVCDCFVSLVRQQILHPELQADLSHSPLQAAWDGIPSFSTLDPFRPRTSAVIHGLVLSTLLFCATCVAIRYSWIHVLHVRIPEVAFDSYLPFRPSTANDFRSRAISQEKSGPASSPSEAPELISPHIQVDVMPVETASPVTVARLGDRGISVPHALPANSGTPLELEITPFLGTYISRSPKVTVVIRMQSGSLAMSVDGEQKQSLIPVSTTVFSIEGVENGRVEFVPDKDGRIQQLQLVEGRSHITAMRQ